VDINRIKEGDGKGERLKSVNGDSVRSSNRGENRGEREEGSIINISRLYSTYSYIYILGADY
jgi:hypothetical protein